MKVLDSIALTVVLAVPACATAVTPTQAPSTDSVDSADGVAIVYESRGEGELTLLFVHGWSCDRRYWKHQIQEFAEDYHVVALDLAGHGDSGIEREQFTMTSFGNDVVAVVDATGASQVILIGHSMGGAVIAEAARLMPDRVVALIGIDTLQDVAYVMSRDELQTAAAPFEEHFAAGMEEFLATMFVVEPDGPLADWVRANMSATPPGPAIDAFRQYLGQYVSGEAARVFQDIAAPVICLNAATWPTNVESNREQMASFDVTIMEDVGHFLMLEDPTRFNRHLAQIITDISSSRTNLPPPPAPPRTSPQGP